MKFLINNYIQEIKLMSDPLVDPLKVHTFGVKRPLEEKKAEIDDLYKNHKRYYPTDKKGELDEWGAVIKNQNEMFTRLDNMSKIQKRKDMQDYSHELVKESDTRKREEKYNQQQQKQFDYSQAMSKKQEADFLNQQTQATKKNMQSMLANDYSEAMRLKRMKQDEERRMDLMEGKAADQKAGLELSYLQNAERDKRNMIKEIFKSEKNAYDDRKSKQTNQSYNLGRAEHQKLMADNEKREVYRDYLDSQKYNNFNQFQNKIKDTYQQQVYGPEAERQRNRDYFINKGEQERKMRDDANSKYKENAHLNMRLNNRAYVEKQIKDKQNNKAVGQTEYQVDMMQRKNHEK